jgi:Protein of unknown function (DUF2628)
MFCSKCGARIAPQFAFCASCGAPTAPPGGSPAEGLAAVAAPADRYPYLSPYWRAVFQRFDQRSGQMQTYWNWPAFFFGAFWYLVKGLPAKAAIYFVLCIVTAGVGWLFLAFYAGFYGPWDYYLKEAYGKQLW